MLRFIGKLYFPCAVKQGFCCRAQLFRNQYRLVVQNESNSKLPLEREVNVGLVYVERNDMLLAGKKKDKSHQPWLSNKNGKLENILCSFITKESLRTQHRGPLNLLSIPIFWLSVSGESFTVMWCTKLDMVICFIYRGYCFYVFLINIVGVTYFLSYTFIDWYGKYNFCFFLVQVWNVKYFFLTCRSFMNQHSDCSAIILSEYL